MKNQKLLYPMPLYHRLIIFLFSFTIPGCSGIFFVPDSTLVLTPAKLNLNYTDVYIKTGSTQLHGWLLKGKTPVRGTVVFLHGNAQNISYHIASVRWLPQHHFNVFLYDYRGFGQSTGKSTLANAISDLAPVFQRLTDILPEKEQKYAVFGQSLGGALSIAGVANLHKKYPIKLLITDSAFSDFRKIAHEKMNNIIITRYLSGLLKYLFPSQPNLIDNIRLISPIPIVIIHGLSDRIVPPAHALPLFENAQTPKKLHLQSGARHIQSLAFPNVRKMMLKALNAAMLERSMEERNGK